MKQNMRVFFYTIAKPELTTKATHLQNLNRQGSNTCLILCFYDNASLTALTVHRGRYL